MKSAPNTIHAELAKAREELEQLHIRMNEFSKLPLKIRLARFREIIHTSGKIFFLNHLIHDLEEELYKQPPTTQEQSPDNMSAG
ncbi:hypothetical protein QNI16_20960 [Cytophagaceae bacterium YF14B1]|uniref:Uncharacterized protein n=1 Tax=Xanthocytophaga flava TaxID=3048013 RepID=A0AAE3U816_9BACT|nr:hypothetical protein [Xanthocytophaga flavus]MDJ1482986.1 hypothetical protein [Xanthocytophaga flavus]